MESALPRQDTTRRHSISTVNQSFLSQARLLRKSNTRERERGKDEKDGCDVRARLHPLEWPNWFRAAQIAVDDLCPLSWNSVAVPFVTPAPDWTRMIALALMMSVRIDWELPGHQVGRRHDSSLWLPHPPLLDPSLTRKLILEMAPPSGWPDTVVDVPTMKMQSSLFSLRHRQQITSLFDLHSCREWKAKEPFPRVFLVKQPPIGFFQTMPIHSFSSVSIKEHYNNR